MKDDPLYVISESQITTIVGWLSHKKYEDCDVDALLTEVRLHSYLSVEQSLKHLDKTLIKEQSGLEKNTSFGDVVRGEIAGLCLAREKIKELRSSVGGGKTITADSPCCCENCAKTMALARAHGYSAATGKSVVQEWLSTLTFKQQTVLLAAFRGCDGFEKNDPAKPFTKMMRASILKNADTSSEFMIESAFADLAKIDDFFSGKDGGIDQYPVHWLLHFIQAAEIIGYQCPHENVRNYWEHFYVTGVRAMHLNPETREQLDSRLTDTKCFR